MVDNGEMTAFVDDHAPCRAAIDRLRVELSAAVRDVPVVKVLRVTPAGQPYEQLTIHRIIRDLDGLHIEVS
jgi:hypothetical protein